METQQFLRIDQQRTTSPVRTTSTDVLAWPTALARTTSTHIHTWPTALGNTTCGYVHGPLVGGLSHFPIVANFDTVFRYDAFRFVGYLI